MAIKINVKSAAKNGTNFKINVKGSSKQVTKIYQNVSGATKLVWENWKLKTGTLVNISKSGTYGGNNSSPYYTEKVTFNKETRISEMSMYTKVLRSDIGGRQDGRIKVFGIKNDGTQIVIADVTNQWTTSTVVPTDTKTGFIGVNVGFWLTDEINRTHEINFAFKITKWYEKG